MYDETVNQWGLTRSCVRMDLDFWGLKRDSREENISELINFGVMV